MRRHMIDLAILGLLTDQELHGYELKKRLAELLGARASVSFGSLYPALGRLERQGAVQAVQEHTGALAAPMSGSLAGELAAFRARVRASGLARGRRGKKVYAITQRGRARLAELLGDPEAADDRAFALRVALCRHLPPADRLALFERRRAELLRRRDELVRRGQRGRADAGRIDSYLRALIERDATTIDHDLAWLDRLIAAERRAATAEGQT